MMMDKLPFRLALAQVICRPLPPIFAQVIREMIYPRQLAYQDNSPVTVRSQTGSLYSGHTADHHVYPFSVHGYYYWRAWAIVRAVCAVGDTLIEVGANVGTETIGFSDIVGQAGRVIAFEPLPENLKALSVALKNAQYKNIALHPLAVGDADTSVLFSAPTKPEDSGIGYVIQPGSQGAGQSIEVKCVRLDSFVDKTIAPRLIFMDVEGFEIRVLRGAEELLREHKPILVLEASPKLLKRAGFSLPEIFSEIGRLGYVPFGVSRLSLVDLNLKTGAKYSNWVCLPSTNGLALRSMINKSLLQCGLFPCVPGLNPMTKQERR